MFRALSIWMLLLLVAAPAWAAISVHDDLDNTVTLEKPAQRIVTLTPHTFELVYAAGGIGRVVGKGLFSHYPPVARHIPEVGDNRQIDVERVLALKPDLLVLWRHGVSQRQIEQLGRLGIPLFFSEPRKLGDIPDSIVRLGKLFGTEKRAEAEAQKLRVRLAELKARYGHRPMLRVFYQISDRPIYTLNDEHIVGEAIRLCGGRNLFGQAKWLAPQVSIESVLAANPDVIIRTSVDAGGEGLALWQKYPMLKAVRQNRLYNLDPDWLDRPGPRMLDGVEALCVVLEQARKQ